MTEVAYLFANGVRLARLAYEPPGDVPSINGENLHVFFELGDHLGSTSVVLDKATGELVERSTYQAYGGTESDYRPERWKSFREDYRFTGKEEDVEAGLIYFGKRFLNPLLNRWVSADPLGIHTLEADPNLYAYVSGRVLQSVDPLGLEGESKYDPNEEAKFFGRTDATRKGTKKQTPARAAPKAAPKASKPLPKRPDIDPDAKAGKGECQGPACGWNKGHGGNIKETDGSDLAAVAGGVLQDQEGPTENGKINGSPGGGCLDCEGSSLQQKLVVAGRVVRGIVEAFGAKIATMAGKLLSHLAGKIDEAANIFRMAKHVPAGGASEVAIHSGIGAPGGSTRISGPHPNHVNGAIGEAHGWQRALDGGHEAIQAPGKVTAKGPDFITFDPKQRAVVLWDAKYRGPKGSFPSSPSPGQIKRWTEDARGAINALPPGALRTRALDALNSGRVKGQIFRWPQ